jgi:hypothetical protein
MKNYFIYILFVLLPLLGSLSCREPAPYEPPVDTSKVKLILVDVAVREAYIGVQLAAPERPELCILQRNGVKVATFTATAARDTILIDTGLTMNGKYTYQAFVHDSPLSSAFNSLAEVKSNPLSVTMLMPTSHDFTFQIDSLGDYQSMLNDVAIVNDSLIYAASAVYNTDSNGNLEYEPNNFLIWKHGVWMENKIYYYYQGNQYISGMTSVFGFGENDVWIANTEPMHWNGTTWEQFDVPSSTFRGYALALWGSSNNDLFMCGDYGSIAHFNGNLWTRVESGVSTSINDAWGVRNPFSGKVEIYCPAYQQILKITNTTHVDSVDWGPHARMNSIWTNKGFPFFTAGNGLFENTRGTWREVNFGLPVVTYMVRGTGLNDIFVIGAFGLILHYNGIDWVIVRQAPGILNSVAVRENMVVAVGFLGSEKGFAIIGRRD